MYSDEIAKPIKILLISNVAFLFLTLMGGTLSELIFNYGALSPASVWGRFEIWRVFTYMFLHGGVFHLLFNMYTLWIFGSILVNDLGERRFWGLYITSGVVAGLFSGLFYLIGGSNTIIVGASGAIMGVLLACARLYPNMPMPIFFFIQVPAKQAVWFYGITSVLFSMSGAMSGVAHLTHLFGLLGGWIFMDGYPILENLYYKQKQNVENKRFKATVAELETRKEYFDTRVDPILDKINKHGLESLTKQERQVLDRAKEVKNPQRFNEVDLERWRRERDR
jgi:membrane associated rhomboid family serine protease